MSENEPRKQYKKQVGINRVIEGKYISKQRRDLNQNVDVDTNISIDNVNQGKSGSFSGYANLNRNLNRSHYFNSKVETGGNVNLSGTHDINVKGNIDSDKLSETEYRIKNSYDVLNDDIYEIQEEYDASISDKQGKLNKNLNRQSQKPSSSNQKQFKKNQNKIDTQNDSSNNKLRQNSEKDVENNYDDQSQNRDLNNKRNSFNNNRSNENDYNTNNYRKNSYNNQNLSKNNFSNDNYSKPAESLPKTPEINPQTLGNAGGEAASSSVGAAASSAASTAGSAAASSAASAATSAASSVTTAAAGTVSSGLAALASNPYFWVVIAIVAIVIILVIIIIVIMMSLSNTEVATSVSGPIDRSKSKLVSPSYSCSGDIKSPFNVTTTSLSKEEFVNFVRNYNLSNYKEEFSVFKNNAALIYDVAVEKGINPEFVVIRAINEGFAPVSNKAPESNNYWGIGCYNGTNKYSSYSSFKAGVEAFCDTILNYKTNNIYEVMSKYAYIGSKWYYPGNSGDGGCYYSSYIMPYLEELDPSRANVVKTTCLFGTQIPTNDTDQLAYSQYQVNTVILPIREQVFNLGSDDVPVCRGLVATLDPPSPEQIKAAPKLSESGSGTIANLLSRNGSSVADFNNKLLDVVKKDAPGSRSAVVDSAVYLINTAYSYGYRFPYSFSGGHGAGYTNKNGELHDKVSSDYYGLNPYLGEEIYSNGHFGYWHTRNGKTKFYTHLGLDCSGFVTWAFKNGGIDKPISNAVDFKNDPHGKSYRLDETDKYIGQPGDVIASDTHVALIIKYDDSTKSYLVAEESDGLIVSRYRIKNDSKYRVIDMSFYYENRKTQDYESKFNSGRIE